MRLVRLDPGDAGHLAIAARRHIAALESVPGLGHAGCDALGSLHRVLTELDDVAKGGQNAHLAVVPLDNEPCNLTLAQAAAVAHVSVKTLRRRLGEGVLPSSRDGHRKVIPAAALLDWIDEGKPSARRAA